MPTTIEAIQLKNSEGGFLPTQQQELLLGAALLPQEEAIKAWYEWRSISDIDALDSGSFRTLPLVYKKLREYGIEDELMGKLKGMYRRTWYNNHIIFNKIAGLLRTLHDQGFQTLVLKGAALTVGYYRDHGLRPMQDFDVLVRTKQAPDVIHFLRKIGWTTHLEPAENHLAYRHSLPFKNGTGSSMDLHWHVLYQCCDKDDDNDFWEGAESIEISGVETKILNATDQILTLTTHGLCWNGTPPFRWVTDVMVLMQSTKTEIQWQRLIQQAQKRHLVAPVKHALIYLKDKLAAPIPEDVLQELKHTPIFIVDRLHYRYATSDRSKLLLGDFSVVLFHYVRLTKGHNWMKRLWGLPSYLSYVWNVESLGKLAMEFAARSTSRFTRYLRTNN